MIPFISVVMPAFNSERYIKSAVASVIAQTFTDWELIIVDDCSTDHTFEIAEQLSKSDERIQVLQNQTNCGAAASRNTALQHCRGNYIALLDSDDLWEPEKLEKQVQCAIATNADIICCSYAIIDEDSHKKCPDFMVPAHIDFQSMLKRSTISCSTAMLTREIMEKEQFPTNMYHEDLAYWLRLLKNGATAVGVEEVLASYRIVHGSRASNKVRSARNRWKVYRAYLGFSALYSTALLAQYMYFGIVKYRRISQ